MRYGLVSESATDAFLRMCKLVIVKAGNHQALFRQRNGDTGCVTSNPTASPLLGDTGGRAGATSGIKDEVAWVSSHENTALHYFGACLYDVHFVARAAGDSGIRPNVCCH